MRDWDVMLVCFLVAVKRSKKLELLACILPQDAHSTLLGLGSLKLTKPKIYQWAQQ